MKALAQARKALPIFVSAVLLSLAFPPANVSLLVLVALAPWLASLRDTDVRGAKRSGYLFGFLFFLFQMHWLVPFVGAWTNSYALAVIPLVAAALAAGLFYSLVAWLVHRCWRARWPWAVPLVWVGIEGFRAYIPMLAFPWGIVGEPLWRFPAVVQHAAWGTLFLVSASVVLLNVLIASFVWPAKEEEMRIPPRTSIRLGSVLAGLVILSIFRYTQPLKGEMRVYTIAQPAVDMARGDSSEREERLKSAIDSILMTAQTNGTQTVIFPEGMAGVSTSLPPIGPFGPAPTPSVVFGGQRAADGVIYQSAYAYDGEWQYADKTRLVIFGEFVPLRRQLPFLQSFNLPSGDLTPAKTLTTLKVDGVVTGAMLCFEGVFPDLSERHSRNGAQVLAVMSIDDWYEGTMAQEQLYTSSIWRSIESGLPLLRAASKGVSLVTDQRGRIMVQAPYGELTAMRAEVLVPEGSDAFDYRFAFVWLCWLLCGGLVVHRFLPRRKDASN